MQGLTITKNREQTDAKVTKDAVDKRRERNNHKKKSATDQPRNTVYITFNKTRKQERR